ncbi:T9SS type A sorting domain-containing protein [Hymenobacter sp. BT664]|uniref:T9SS type A sorting domain-containing protein n=1 Tax=Hymenobacter montanus TaxID=2771359 RepID=A0A927BHM7_9BACT|nr:T9SS type A sorting domain-containing protein [Hymenobacter montanus]MBD2770415.1 T9SS type A sorting domain-containing protein [Hymenobacter montanus]
MRILPIRKTLFSGLLALTSLGAWAQKGNLELRVVDQQTGFAVRNARIELLNATGKKEELATRANGKLALPNREGELSFLISAPGYAPLSTHFTAGTVAQLNAEIQLDRLQPLTPERNSQKQSAALAPNQTYIDGYVSDRERGMPLAGVQVRMGTASAVSDENGYYQLLLTSNESQKGPKKEEFVKEVADVTFSHDGYTTYQIRNFRVIGQDYTFKNSLAPLPKGSETRAGRGSVPTETENSVHGFYDKTGAEPEPEPEPLQKPKAVAPAKGPDGTAARVAVPASIRVGTSCSCNSCSSVSVMSLETYVRSGIDDEWPPYFGANSLRAGSVAYRSYGAYYVINRSSGSSFDISSTTCRQVWSSATNKDAAAAADFTAGQVLVKDGAISRPEYSSENNNAGCGNGFAGTNTAGAPCISDPLCKGRATFGHGRGMCQFGSKFWGESGKSYTWILDHYYQPINIVLQGGATTPQPPQPPQPPVTDTTPPTTSITGPSSAMANFTATFTDADNRAVAARFYQPLEWRNGEWRANRGNGFYNDNFGAATLHPDYALGLADWQGSWAPAQGRLRQSNTTATNTALSTFLSQQAGNTYLYTFAAKVNNTTGNRRFGLHIMASDVSVRERGNSYLIWFALDQQKVSLIETIDNVLTPRASADVSILGGTFSDYKVVYNTTTGVLSAYLNNRLVVSWTDPTPLTTGAHISLRTSEADVEFDDLKVLKSRGTTALITVGAANSNDVRTSASPGAKIKSLVKDEADNWSEFGNLDVNITIPASLTGQDASAVTVYPNPVTGGKLTINYALEADAEVSIDIFDGQGTKVKTLVSRETKGTHQVVVPAQSLGKQGFYLVKVSTGDKSQTVRLLKD